MTDPALDTPLVLRPDYRRRFAALPIPERARATRQRRFTFEDQVTRLLPINYSIMCEDYAYLYISGHDDAGWTLDGYVIPRLASGLIWAVEMTTPEHV